MGPIDQAVTDCSPLCTCKCCLCNSGSNPVLARSTRSVTPAPSGGSMLPSPPSYRTPIYFGVPWSPKWSGPRLGSLETTDHRVTSHGAGFSLARRVAYCQSYLIRLGTNQYSLKYPLNTGVCWTGGAVLRTQRYQINTVQTPGFRTTSPFATCTRRRNSHAEHILGLPWPSALCTPLVPHTVYPTYLSPPLLDMIEQVVTDWSPLCTCKCCLCNSGSNPAVARSTRSVTPAPSGGSMLPSPPPRHVLKQPCG